MRKFIFLLFLIIFPVYANEFKAQVVNKKIFVGDIIKYKITFPFPKEKIIFEENEFSPFELIKKEKKYKNGKTSFIFGLSIYKTGKFKIPALKFKTTKNGKEDTITIPPKEITVISVLKNSKDLKLKDIKPVAVITEKTYIPFYAATGILLLAILYFLFKKQKNKKPTDKITIEKKLPAHETAYKKLSELMQKELIKKGKLKDFAFELSEIIREFLGERYKFDSIELTSDELINYLKKEPSFNREYLTVINNFLEDTDIIKFSKIETEVKELENLTKLAFKIVNDLKQEIND